MSNLESMHEPADSKEQIAKVEFNPSDFSSLKNADATGGGAVGRMAGGQGEMTSHLDMSNPYGQAKNTTGALKYEEGAAIGQKAGMTGETLDKREERILGRELRADEKHVHQLGREERMTGRELRETEKREQALRKEEKLVDQALAKLDLTDPKLEKEERVLGRTLKAEERKEHRLEREEKMLGHDMRATKRDERQIERELKSLDAGAKNKDGILKDLDKDKERPMRLGAKLDELSTGDEVLRAGNHIGINMPSGEHLSIDPKGWSLKDAKGDELANSHNMPAKLEDGTTIEHIVPIRGPGWTNIDYPNGDSVEIRENDLTITRGDKHADVPKVLTMPDLDPPLSSRSW